MGNVISIFTNVKKELSMIQLENGLMIGLEKDFLLNLLDNELDLIYDLDIKYYLPITDFEIGKLDYFITNIDQVKELLIKNKE